MYRFAGIVLAVLMAASSAAAQDATSTSTPTVVTTGEAVVRRAPDQAFVTIAVETRAASPRQAQQLNADAMTSVQQRITTARIERNAIRTTGYSIQQEFEFANGRRTPRGYIARNGVEIRVDEVDRTGELLDAFVDAGATTVTGVRFDVKDRASAEREALRLAVVDARARAEAMAAGAGRNVDRVVRIADAVQPRYRAEPMLMSAQRGAVAESITPIEAGPIEIRAQVELTATIK